MLYDTEPEHNTNVYSQINSGEKNNCEQYKNKAGKTFSYHQI